MSQKRYAKDPLLYIQQPHISTPAAQMQFNYKTPKQPQNEAKINTQQRGGSQQSRSGRKTIRKQPGKGFAMEEGIEEEVLESEESAEQKVNTKPRPKFKEMSLKEKIEYFAEGPTHLPKMKCEIKTADKTYRGMITEFDGETVYIRGGRSSRVKPVPLQQIKRVSMLGL